MQVRAISTPNIALIKYWGNRNDELRLPAADSLSFALDRPTVEVVIGSAKQFSARSFGPDGIKRELSEKESGRLLKHFLITKKYLREIGSGDGFPKSVSLEIKSQIPKSVGLASSSAIFSALAEGYAKFAGKLTRREVSVIARLGSGSASRSVFSGFAAMIAGQGDSIGSSYAVQIAPKKHWTLWDIIIVPSTKEKETGSTEGHALARTSPLFEDRLREIPRRQKMCIEAVLQKDFEKLQKVAEEDSLNMHAVMASSTPPLNYLSEETHRIIREITALRERERLAVLYTMDAGPTVHLLCTKDALSSVRAYARAQDKCAIFEACIGRGSHLL